MRSNSETKAATDTTGSSSDSLPPAPNPAPTFEIQNREWNGEATRQTEETGPGKEIANGRGRNSGIENGLLSAPYQAPRESGEVTPDNQSLFLQSLEEELERRLPAARKEITRATNRASGPREHCVATIKRSSSEDRATSPKRRRLDDVNDRNTAMPPEHAREAPKPKSNRVWESKEEEAR